MEIMRTEKSSKAYQEEHELMMRVLFGDKELGEMGMKEQVDAIYAVLMQIKSVNGFFSGIGTFIKYLLVVAGFIVVIKGWWSAAVSSVLK